MKMKMGKEIHDIFIFYTPQLMDIYFDYLKNKIQKVEGVTTLLVQGAELPNVHSESHLLDNSLIKVFPNIKEVDTLVDENNEELKEVKVDLAKQMKIKKFNKSTKANQFKKSCIINRKAS